METDQIQSSMALYMRLLKSVKPYWFIFAIGILTTLSASAIDAGISWAIKPALDKGIVAKNTDFLILLPIGITLIAILRGLTNFASDYCITKVGRSVVMDFRQKVFSHMLHLPASFYDKQSSGKLLSLVVYNIEQLASASTEALLTIISEGSLAIGLVVVMFILSWQLTTLFIIAAPLATIVMHYTTKRLRRISLNVQQSVAEVTHIANESIEGYRVIRTYGGENYETEKFKHATLLNCQRELKTVITNSIGSSSIQFIAAIPIALIVYMATLPSLHVSVGSFAAIITAIVRILTPLKRLTKINTSIQKGVAAAQSIFELIDSKPEKDSGTKSIKHAYGKIEYDCVSFQYPNTAKPVLVNTSFIAEPGQVIAIVGHSGSGKSTLVSLLPRFYDVNSGKILLDKINIQDYKLSDLRQQFALVSQHVTLFNDTIAHNIAYGKIGEVDQEIIAKAAEAAYLLPLIRELPNGFATIVGEQGLLLSGGQRQRIAIARAILKDAPILILDEATSALDNESERYLQEALEKLMEKRTTLVIAHRLSTVEKADQILVLDQGNIVERGTHRELLNLGNYYARLYSMQFKDDAVIE